jgi:hypothetical protein
MTRKRKLLIVVAALIVLGALCYLLQQRRLAEHRKQVVARATHCASFAPDRGTYVQTFHRGLTTHPKITTLVEQYNNLKRGQSETDVIALLGTPTFTHVSSSPEGASSLGCEWTFVLRAAGDNLLDSISVHFDQNGTVRDWSRIDQNAKPMK